MTKAHHWTCPYCDRDTTLRNGDYSAHEHKLTIDNSDGYRKLISGFTICPNPKCRKITLRILLFEIFYDENFNNVIDEKLLKEWNLVPSSKAKAYPDYIPQAIKDDYSEACVICELSPKASATLSRRCLQGILRDFWKVKAGNLNNEIEQIKDKIDPLTWEAIDSVRKIGNIGAHMEKDINLIVDVEPHEAELLIDLIETLIQDWYINREERKARLNQIISISNTKDKVKRNK